MPSNNSPSPEPTVAELARRVSALEAAAGGGDTRTQVSTAGWWHRELGRFADDSVYAEIVRRGRESRESTRPADGE